MAEHQFIGIYKHGAPLRRPCFQPQAEKGITGDHNDDGGQPCAVQNQKVRQNIGDDMPEHNAHG